ncbi:pectate lyase [Vigna unguiculata]|uniref:Pectate lyase n=1 Tax=Vigna unguiculata TaxID=3917 RepID=A0A4D6M259_VIGUN|nr:pectate lyase [Vigna unguiculata]
MNVIDRCWRKNPEWRRHQYQLATCCVGYAGKMIKNIGNDLIHYKVTDSSDDPINPKPNTLRYGTSILQGKVWITFQKDMQIELKKTLLISSFTTIDGRGVNVHIANNACLMIFKATNIIIHGIRVHHCKPQAPGSVMGPEGKVIPLGHVDGDAIRLVTASKIWIDHNTLYDCQDGLLDVTRGSTDVTISNNWFKNQDKSSTFQSGQYLENVVVDPIDASERTWVESKHWRCLGTNNSPCPPLSEAPFKDKSMTKFHAPKRNIPQERNDWIDNCLCPPSSDVSFKDKAVMELHTPKRTISRKHDDCS